MGAGRKPAAESDDYSPHGRLAPEPETESANALQGEPEAQALEQTADAEPGKTGNRRRSGGLHRGRKLNRLTRGRDKSGEQVINDDLKLGWKYETFETGI